MGGVQGPINAETTFPFDVAGPISQPPANVAAVVLNVTVTQTADAGYLTVWPAGQARPTASNLNWQAGQTVANLVTVAAGGGALGFYVNHSRAQIVADIEGYYGPDTGSGGEFRPLMPARILDTRIGLGGYTSPLGPGWTLTAPVLGVGNVPTTGVAAVVLQLTATDASQGSFLAAYPTGSTYQGTSNTFFWAGHSVGTRVVVNPGTGGRVTIRNEQGWANVVIDVNGYFTSDSVAHAGGLYVPLLPSRVLDTRYGIGGHGALGWGQGMSLGLAGSAVPSSASAAVMNLTATDTTTGSYLTAYPDGNSRTLSSDVNFDGGQTIPNLAVVKLNAGAFALYNGAGSVNAIADLAGYYTAAPSPGPPPSAPQDLQATALDRAVHLTWTPPASSGGTLIVSYAIQIASGPEVLVLGDQTSTTIPSLVNQTAYSFSITATNAAASGGRSGSVGATPLGTPDTPDNVQTSAGQDSISLTWHSPANNGGAPILYFRIEVWPTGQVFPVAALGVTIPSAPGVAYCVAVRAVNQYGAGPSPCFGPIIPGQHRVVINLAQQTLRAYSGSGVLMETLVTTGRPQLPTPPGVYHVMAKYSPFHFISPWGPSSPFWYQDAWVSYADLFIDGGYFLHDAPWRSWFGPGSQYGDGTHGCVNIPIGAMTWLHNWLNVGDEVDVVS